jgi:hypothetical protein
MTGVGQELDNTPTVEIGRHVEIEMVGKDGSVEAMKFNLVVDESADFARGFLGESTPLAKAILGKSAGSVIPYSLGDLREVRVLSVTEAEGLPDEDVNARRQAKIQEAIEKSDRTSAMIFASSFSGKWGDYDPDGIEHWEQGPEKKSDSDIDDQPE